MVDIKITALLAVTAVNLLIASYVFFKQRHHRAAVGFIFFSVGISLWAMTNALFQLTEQRTVALVAAWLSYYAGIVIAAPFYAFTANFPKQLSSSQRIVFARKVWLFCIVWLAVLSIPGLTLKDVIVEPTRSIITGPGLYFHFLSVAFFILAGFVRLWKKRTHATLQERRQINLILVGALIPAAAGITFNLVLPLLGYYEYVWLGPNFTLILVVFMAYAMVRHSLFNIRVLAVEMFAGLLGLVIVVEWLQSRTTSELVTRGAVVVVYAFLSWQLVSSVRKEIKARETLQHLLEQKTDFINMASHQLRSPLTAIRGLLTMLHDGDYDHDSPEKKKQVLKNALISSERLSRVVNDLLEAAELEKGMLGEVATESVAPLVQQSIDTLRTNYEQKKVRLNYHAPKQSLPLCKMRTRYLQQVFVNLIDNAQRYTPKGGQVDVRLYVNEQHQIVFETKDSGIGIAEEDVPKLFNKFYRADNAKEIQSGGTGLGLYIVKQIVEDHGGSVEVHSAGLGLGTLFRVILPAAV
jgi:signal transduction histidine kinase